MLKNYQKIIRVNRRNDYNDYRVNQQSGQSIVEMLIALPLLLMLIFGILQWGFISRAKVTLNTATELAARSGALNYGKKQSISGAFAEGMIPLFMRADPSIVGLIKAKAEAKKSVSVFNQAKITLVNPSSQVWNEFKKSVVYPMQSKTIEEIPNDNLMFRPSTQKTLSAGVKMNIQDANLLKIQVEWCQELIVPIMGDLIVSWSTNILGSVEQLRCNGLSTIVGKPLIAMQSSATYRMQTPFRNL